MRWIMLLALCACTAQAFAATLSGSITLAGAAKMKVDIGYVGLNAANQQIEGTAGALYGASTPAAYQAANGTRKSIVHWTPRGGFKYQFTNVPAGKYLLYACAGNRFEEWKMIPVSKDAKAITTDITLNLAHTGGLRLKAGKGKGRYTLLLTPCAPNGDSLYPKADLMHFAIIEMFDTDSIRLGKLKPGAYQLVLKGGSYNGKPKKITILDGKISDVTI